MIREVDIDTAHSSMDMDSFEQQLSQRTKLVRVGYASNATGTINDVAEVIKLAHRVGALVFVNAVHYAPHGPIDVKALHCDFLTCSAYKFFAPHMGILYSKQEHLAKLKPYKVKAA